MPKAPASPPERNADGSLTVELAPLTFRADLVPTSVDRSARTVEVLWTTGAPVTRFDWMTGSKYIERLAVTPGAVRLERLNNGAPFLNSHNSYDLGDVIGVIVPGSARISKGEGRATVKFSARPDVAGIWQDVQDGVVRAVSVGYRVHKYEQTDATDGRLAERLAIDWEPYEISAVPMGADPAAQMRSERANVRTNPCVLTTHKESAMPEETRTEQTTETAAVVDERDPGAPTQPAPRVERTGEPTERQVGAEAERLRVQGILTAVRNAGFPTATADAYIRDGISLEQAQTKVLEELARIGAAGPRSASGAPDRIFRDGARITVEGDHTRHVYAGIENALLHRVAPSMFKLDDLGRAYAGGSLLELARYTLQARGLRVTGLSKMEVAGLALGLSQRGAMHTTSDFANILADVVNKTLRQAYEEAPQTFKTIARQVELPDFKPVRRVQLGEAPKLLEVKEHGEFTRGTIGDAKEQYQLATYGRVFGITRQAIVNDDTDAFSRVSMMFGRSARNLESDLVWAQITSNPTMGDGTVLFHTDHKNLAGSAAVISVTSIGIGRAAMRNQTALDGLEYLNVNPRYLIVPPGKETVADQFVSTALLASQSSNVNPFAGRLEVIAEPRLEAASATAWYLAATPDQIDMVEYGFLAGEAGPVVESRVGFDVDGLEIKCRHDVAAKVIDWRGFFKNAGA